MATTKLKSDATIKDVLPTLEKPEEYVRIVLGHLMACKRKPHLDPRVRIGITGTGKMPYHKIVYLTEAGTEGFFAAYDGAHEFGGVIQDHTWSSAAMTITEVQSVLGDLRGFKSGASTNA
jgi:hypothetical protein